MSGADNSQPSDSTSSASSIKKDELVLNIEDGNLPQDTTTSSGLSRNLSEARKAHKNMDAEASRAAHEKKRQNAVQRSGTADEQDFAPNDADGDGQKGIEMNQTLGNDGDDNSTRGWKNHSAAQEKHDKVGGYLKPVVFGGVDGIITTFAVLSSSTGANLAIGTAIILGLANLVGDGLSMGIGEYLSSKAEYDYAVAERKRELWETENYLEGEKQEMVEIYQGRGMSKADAVAVIDIMSKYKDVFVDTMLVDELGIQPPDANEQPWKSGIAIFCSFCVFGFLPLLVYIIAFATGQRVVQGFNYTYMASCIVTALCLFSLGVLKSRVTNQKWYKSGGVVLATGGIAAIAAFLLGILLEPVLGK
ncbi:hypothetical protein MIR68_008079 [Amoeboaphelidium protococcarum]|nr:hypothetical protein MIR68_008079 [Amoeboaphelidium protococcarum]